MTYKNYAVVVLSKDENAFIAQTLSDNYPFYENYDDAFDAFNQALVDVGGKQLFTQPKGENPLHAETEDYYVELWIITRTTDLIKNKN